MHLIDGIWQWIICYINGNPIIQISIFHIILYTILRIIKISQDKAISLLDRNHDIRALLCR